LTFASDDSIGYFDGLFQSTIFSYPLVMQITEEALKEFKKIYEEDYQEKITEAEALEMAQGLINLFSIIARPFPQKQSERENLEEQNQNSF